MESFAFSVEFTGTIAIKLHSNLIVLSDRHIFLTAHQKESWLENYRLNFILYICMNLTELSDPDRK